MSKIKRKPLTKHERKRVINAKKAKRCRKLNIVSGADPPIFNYYHAKDHLQQTFNDKCDFIKRLNSHIA